MLGGAALTLFATSRTLVNSIRQVVSICINVSWTDMTRMEAVGEHARLQIALKLVVIVSTATCLAIAVPLWFEGASVIQVWTGHKLAPDVPLLRFLLAYVILQTPWMSASLVPLSSNKNRRLAISYLVANATGIAIAAVIVRPLGMIGVPLGLMCGEAIACYHFVPFNACRIVGEPYPRFAARVWLGLALTAAVSLFAAWEVHQLGALPTVIRWLMSGLVSTVVVAAATWFGWLPIAERRILRAKLAYGWGRIAARTVSA
jgi:O-antigen/teichoic acid export membrane protein